MTHRKGEVWLVDFRDLLRREQSGRRPAVVVSADQLNESRAGVVIVVPTTTTYRGLASHIEIEPRSSGLDEVSHAKCEDVKSINKSGKISGGGSGSYTDAHWHLYGQNGDNGSFDCYPPITAGPFEVDVKGHAGGGRATVSLSMPDATETNADYDCGADYTGFATTTTDMADSLSTAGGDHLDISLGHPTTITAQKTTSSGGGATVRPTSTSGRLR